MLAIAAAMPAAPGPRHFDVAAELFPDYPQGFPYENFDPKLVQPPADDDYGIPSDDEDGIGEEDVEAETGFGSVISELSCLHVLCL